METNPQRKFEFVVSQEQSGERLDKALASFSEVQSRSRADQLITAGAVSVNGIICTKSSTKVKLGDKLEVLIPEPKSGHLLKLDLNLDILFEDEDLIVINKPPNLVMHPAAGHENDTLVNALLNHTDDLSMAYGEDRPGIVHRLDKDTSGVLVVAKNDFTHKGLASQFEDRSIERFYFAMVLGVPPKTEGKMTSNLGRHPRDRKKFASVTSGGKWAETSYWRISHHLEGISYIKLKLGTGRTHQIRVHLSEMGCPILGDSVYGGDRFSRIKSVSLKQRLQQIPRMALHAAILGFTHPRTQERLHFQVPWPSDISPFLKELKFQNATD
ncbi:MAG: RluA family pseudouridine synthase [Pseudobdellovibrionaceae bacterium]